MLADASIGKIYFLNMWDDSAFRTYYGRMVWYIIYDDSSSTYIGCPVLCSNINSLV